MKTIFRRYAPILAAFMLMVGFGVMEVNAAEEPVPTAQKVSKRELKKMQAEAQAKRVKALLADDEFVFVAELMTAAQPGNSQALNGSYIVKIEKDEIDCSLPFIGNTSASHYSADSGSPFVYKSKDFTFTKKEGKKSIKYVFSIDPQGVNNHLTFYFEVWYKNGRAVLNAVQSKGDKATYDGYIKPVVKK